MTNELYLSFYIGVIVISTGITVRLYRKATPEQRRRMILPLIAAIAVPLLIILYLATR